MSKRFLAILAVIIIGFIGIYFFGSKNKAGITPGSSSYVQPTNHVMGSGSSGVTLLEYGDYQCPVCGAYYPVVKQVVSQMSNKIYFQFRNLPLSSIHQNAVAGARAAEAAGKQNKYFEMHDILYENQQTWSQSSTPMTYFESYASQLGLDVNKFKTDYASSEVNSLINADLSAFAQTKQQEATPTFFINGVYISNSDVADSNGPSASKLTDALNKAIAAQSQNK